MVYNYSVFPGQSFKIKTPGVDSFQDIIKDLKSDGEININHSLYPNTQLPYKIIITTNMELIENSDGSYSINN